MTARAFLLASVCCMACSNNPPIANDGGAGGSTGGGSTGGGSTGGGSTGGGLTGGGSAGGGSVGGGSPCSPACTTARTCCGTACVNTANDPNNCGGCGIVCSGTTPYCDGSCQPRPCSLDAGVCQASQTCCGSTCCGTGQICCETQGPLSRPPQCHTPTAMEPTCPQGCAPLCASDRAIKSDIRPVDERKVLERVARLPLSTWRYRSDEAQIRHLGPMAQDFYDAFGLGSTDKAYHSIDAHGVSLASIKALYQLIQEQEARLRRLEGENAALKTRTCSPEKRSAGPGPAAPMRD